MGAELFFTFGAGHTHIGLFGKAFGMYMISKLPSDKQSRGANYNADRIRIV